MAESNLHRVVSRYNTSRYLNIIIPAYVYDRSKYKRAECKLLPLAVSERGVAVPMHKQYVALLAYWSGCRMTTAAEQMVNNSDKHIIR